jgi:hypothetical protein
MKFLIVNDFRGTKYSEKIMKDFDVRIKKVDKARLDRAARKVGHRHRNGLLHGQQPRRAGAVPDVGFTNTRSGKNFDLVDIVMINGDYKYRPWAKEYLGVGLA